MTYRLYPWQQKQKCISLPARHEVIHTKPKRFNGVLHEGPTAPLSLSWHWHTRWWQYISHRQYCGMWVSLQCRNNVLNPWLVSIRDLAYHIKGVVIVHRFEFSIASSALSRTPSQDGHYLLRGGTVISIYLSFTYIQWRVHITPASSYRVVVWIGPIFGQLENLLL